MKLISTTPIMFNPIYHNIIGSLFKRVRLKMAYTLREPFYDGSKKTSPKDYVKKSQHYFVDPKLNQADLLIYSLSRTIGTEFLFV